MRKTFLVLIMVSITVSMIPMGISAIEDKGGYFRLIPTAIADELTETQKTELKDPEWGSIFVIRYLDLNQKARVAITISEDGTPIKMKVDDSNIHGEISRDNAVQRAENYALNKGLLPTNYGKVKAVKIDDTEDYDAWLVYWGHEINGIKIRDDHLTIKVGPIGVLGFTKRWTDIQDIELQNIISKEDAISKATNTVQGIEYFQKNNLKPSVMATYLEVVPANRYWSGEPIVWPKEKVLAYVVEMRQDNRKLEIWIDAKTGEVIGGDQTKSINGKGNPITSIALILLVGILVLGAKKIKNHSYFF